MPLLTASVSEIFSSLQGEGPRMGERHLFLRFEACHVHCGYCDEFGKPGRDYDLDAVLESIVCLEREKGPHSFVSLTGGEPLLYMEFLNHLLPELKRTEFKIYLETNGILWRALEEIKSYVDVIAMDLKPASVTGERSFALEHREFLRRAGDKEVFVKMVCSKEIDLLEFKDLCGMVCETRRQTPLILQPVTGPGGEGWDVSVMQLLMELQTIALGILPNVRMMPRLHKILNLR